MFLKRLATVRTSFRKRSIAYAPILKQKDGEHVIRWEKCSFASLVPSVPLPELKGFDDAAAAGNFDKISTADMHTRLLDIGNQFKNDASLSRAVFSRLCFHAQQSGHFSKAKEYLHHIERTLNSSDISDTATIVNVALAVNALETLDFENTKRYAEKLPSHLKDDLNIAAELKGSSDTDTIQSNAKLLDIYLRTEDMPNKGWLCLRVAQLLLRKEEVDKANQALSLCIANSSDILLKLVAMVIRTESMSKREDPIEIRSMIDNCANLAEEQYGIDSLPLAWTLSRMAPLYVELEEIVVAEGLFKAAEDHFVNLESKVPSTFYLGEVKRHREAFAALLSKIEWNNKNRKAEAELILKKQDEIQTSRDVGMLEFWERLRYLKYSSLM